MVPVKPVPVMITDVPAGPLVGLKLLILGITRKFVMLEIVPPGVWTVTGPVLAPSGTRATRYVSELTWGTTPAPLKVTRVAPVKPLPKISTKLPTGPDDKTVFTLAPRFTSRMKNTPSSKLPPPAKP